MEGNADPRMKAFNLMPFMVGDVVELRADTGKYVVTCVSLWTGKLLKHWQDVPSGLDVLGTFCCIQAIDTGEAQFVRGDDLLMICENHGLTVALGLISRAGQEPRQCASVDPSESHTSPSTS